MEEIKTKSVLNTLEEKTMKKMNNKVAKKIATGYSNPQRHSNFQKYGGVI